MGETRRSRRERPAKPALTRAGIVAAAIGIMQSKGLEKLTMRRLAAELDTGPASLYVYVANTAALHAAVLDELLGEVDLAESVPGGWQDRLVAVLTSYVSVLMANPQLARSAVTTRPNGPNYLHLIERMLHLLADGDVAPQRAAWGVDVLLLAATAHAAEHAETSPATREQWDTLNRTLEGIDARRYPHIHELAGDLLGGTPADRLTWTFRALIDGLRHTQVPGE